MTYQCFCNYINYDIGSYLIYRYFLNIFQTKSFDLLEDVKFHDPSEFAQNPNQQQQMNINMHDEMKNEYAHQTNHGHDDHKHGIGESVDKE